MRFLHSRAVICLLLLVPALPFLFPRRRGLNFNALHSREHHFNTGFLQSQRRELLISYFTLKATRCDEYANQFRTIEAERNPLWRKINVVAAYLNSVIVGLICVIIMKTLNKFTVYRLPVLLDLVFERETDRGLLTVSNHQSVLDDPGIWGAMIPFWRLKPSQLRWVLCTEDVFFAKRWLTRIFQLGNVLPLDRGGSIEQPTFQLFKEKLSSGSWCHIFPEGRVWQNWRFDVPNERVLGPFKYGVGKLIAHSYPNVPIVLPVYHTGMSGIIPEVQQQTTDSEMPDRISKPKRKKSKASKPISILPRTGNHIEVFVGQPMDFTEDIKEFNAQHPGALTSWGSTLECIRLYEHITDKVRLQMEVLEAEAYGRQVAPTVMEDQEPHEETVVQKIEIVGSSFAFSEPVAV